VATGRASNTASGAGGRVVDQLIEVARRFYLGGETQVDIARDLGLDPSTVSRYLKRARDEGVVRVEIRPPRRRDVELGRRLADAFHLSRAIVGPTEDGPALPALASVSAEYIGTLLRTGMRVGLGWGTSLSATVDYLEPGAVSNLVISQLAGGLSSPVPGIQGHELARQLAGLYPGSRVQYLHAPSIVDSRVIHDALLSDRSVQSALAMAASSELALVGIGEIGPNATLLQPSQLTREDLDRLAAEGVVGSMNGRFFCADGLPGGHLDDRTIAIEWEQLRAIPTVVAVAAGKHKIKAIRGALRTECVDVLCTDERTADVLLKNR
jgi:DNA-binding transcriptional regulator LsrR (DeoR family)